MSRSLAFLLTALLGGMPAPAQQAVSSSAFGNGGGASNNGSSYLLGSVGQTFAGVTGNSSHLTRIGLHPVLRFLVPPALSLPASVAVGEVVWGTSGSTSFLVSNSGKAPLRISALTVSDSRFSVSPTAFTVAAGGSQSVTVTFTPTQIGLVSATITVSSLEALVGSRTIGVSASGIGGAVTDFSLTHTPSIVAGGGFTIEVTFFNASGRAVPFTGAVTLSGVSGGGTTLVKNASSLLLPVQTQETRDGGSSTQVSFTVSVEGVGTRTGSFQLVHRYAIPALLLPVVEVWHNGEWVRFSDFAFVGGKKERLRMRSTSTVPSRVSLDISYEREEGGQKVPAMLFALSEWLEGGASREFGLVLPHYLDVAGGSAPLRLFMEATEGPRLRQPDGEEVRYLDVQGLMQAAFAPAVAEPVGLVEEGGGVQYGAHLQCGVRFAGEEEVRLWYAYDAREANGTSGGHRFAHGLVVGVDQDSPLKVLVDGRQSHLDPAQVNRMEVQGIEAGTAVIALWLGPLWWKDELGVEALPNALPQVRGVRAEAWRPRPGNPLEVRWWPTQQVAPQVPLRVVIEATDRDEVGGGIAEVGVLIQGEVVARQEVEGHPKEVVVEIEIPPQALEGLEGELVLVPYAVDRRGGRTQAGEEGWVRLEPIQPVVGVAFSPWAEGHTVLILPGDKPGQRLIAIGMRLERDQKSTFRLASTDAARVEVVYADGKVAPADNYRVIGAFIVAERTPEGEVRLSVQGGWDARTRRRTTWLRRYAGVGLVNRPSMGSYVSPTGEVWKDAIFPLVEEVRPAAKRVATGSPLTPEVLEELRQAMLERAQGLWALADKQGAWEEPARGWAEEAEEAPHAMLPQATRLLAPYPNPFNPFTQIVFELGMAGRVRLSVYDGLGQEVRRLVEEEWWPGVYRVVWDGRDESGDRVSSGVYFWRLQSGEGQQTRKMLLLR